MIAPAYPFLTVLLVYIPLRACVDVYRDRAIKRAALRYVMHLENVSLQLAAVTDSISALACEVRGERLRNLRHVAQ